MITYNIWGSLPVQWEDFYSQDKAYPHVSIFTKREADGNVEEDEGWLFIVLDVDEIDEKAAKQAIADALHVKPEAVHIEQEGWCQTVSLPPLPGNKQS